MTTAIVSLSAVVVCVVWAWGFHCGHTAKMSNEKYTPPPDLENAP